MGEEALAPLRAMLERIVEASGLEATVSVYPDGEGVVCEVEGDDLAALIGHHGHALDAIQHLAYRVAAQATGERCRVLVDIAGYRQRRAETLCAEADTAAGAAVRDGHPIALGAMSALERKLVHEHLRDRHDIETYSEGEEPARRLMVAPLIG